MRLPRDISGKELARRLRPLGYDVVRRVGSHMQLRTTERGQQHITIPAHESLRIGTLDFVLSTVARHLGVDRRDLVMRLFGDRA